MTLFLTIPVEIDTLPASLANALSHEELIAFITNIDKLVADWDFTLKLAEHFKKLEETYKREVKP